mmetsp:Transcript_88314/g.230492  ORF Transcript_88314/g.230492 Transcript_88314/m.230492 type:complete len:412 (-) Transcript_88314:36-1271(-)
MRVLGVAEASSHAAVVIRASSTPRSVLSPLSRRPPRSLFCVALSLRLLTPLSLLFLPGTSAYTKQGHERIAKVALVMLKGKYGEHVNKLLKGDLVGLSEWEEEMTRKYEDTAALHFHRQAPEWTCEQARVSNGSTAGAGDGAGVRCDGEGSESGSLFCALAYFFEHFAHDALLNEFPKPKEPIGTPDRLKALAKLTSVEQSPSHYLRWLVTLIGDLHQPLHLLQDANHGRNIKVLYRGNEYSLFAFWEDFLPKQLRPLSANKFLDEQYKARSPAWWDRLPTELFREWAKELSGIACGQILGVIQEQGGGPGPFRVDEELARKWKEQSYELTVLGGQRLAWVLKEILEHRRHKVAHKEGRGRFHPKRSWKKSLAINVGIAACVVPLLLLALRWHEGVGGLVLRRLMREHLKM